MTDLFETLPHEVILLIFKQIGVKDRLRLEAVNKKWKELVIESWKYIRNLEASEIYSPSLTNGKIVFLMGRITPSVETLDLRTTWAEDEDGSIGREIGRQIFLSLSFPPCALREVCFGDVTLDRSILNSLTHIGSQIRSISSSNTPKELFAETEDRRSLFEYFPKIKKLDYMFPGMLESSDHSNSHIYEMIPRETCLPNVMRLNLPPSVEYLNINCRQCHHDCQYYGQEMLERFCSLEEGCALRELHLTGFKLCFDSEEIILSRVAVRFPNLEIFTFDGNYSTAISLDPFCSLKKLRGLYLLGSPGNFIKDEFFRDVRSFAFRKQLEIFHMNIRGGVPGNFLEGLPTFFPNLKDLRLAGEPLLLCARHIKKMFNASKKLRSISLDGCEAVSNELLSILGASCPDVRFLRFSFCPEVTEDGIEKLLCALSEPENVKIRLYRTGVVKNSQKMIVLQKTYGFRAEFL